MDWRRCDGQPRVAGAPLVNSSISSKHETDLSRCILIVINRRFTINDSIHRRRFRMMKYL